MLLTVLLSNQLPGFLSIKALKQKFLLLAVVAQRPSAMTLTISY